MTLKLQNVALLSSMIVLSFALTAIPAFAYDCTNPITNMQKWFCERALSIQENSELISNLEAPSVDPIIAYLVSSRGFPRYGFGTEGRPEDNGSDGGNGGNSDSVVVQNPNTVVVNETVTSYPGGYIPGSDSYQSQDSSQLNALDGRSNSDDLAFFERPTVIPEPVVPPVTPEPVSPPADDYSAYDYSGYWYY